jgi:hypothetical protein
VVLCSSPFLLKTVADGRSSSTMCFGGGAGYWILRLHHELMPLGKIGGGSWRAVFLLLRRAGDRRRGVPAATGSFWWCLGVAMCNFQIPQGAFCKVVGMYCAPF